MERLARAALAATDGLAVIGLCGAQGSGKSTLAAALVARLTAEGVPAATLSLDDLYLTRAERLRLAADAHPLFATRGVPGTHDVALGLAAIDALARGEAARLPRFDKARDDRAPEADWPAAPRGCRLLLLEGWCVGARPEPAERLAEPVNALERDEDPDGRWRRAVNAALAGDYQALWARCHAHALLAAPGWAVVAGWRAEAERALGDRAMPPAALARFMQHYERLTRWTLADLPARVDLLVALDACRRPAAVRLSARPAGCGTASPT